jgi:MHS family proline/betaine transporter-like MFS transporter
VSAADVRWEASEERLGYDKRRIGGALESQEQATPQVDRALIRRSITAGAVGVWVHWFDWAVYAYLSTTLAAVFFPTQNPTVGLLSVFAVFAVAFVFRPLGALFFGPLGDKIGRRQTLALVIITMGIATLAVGLLPSYASVGILAPILLVIVRLVQGFAAGGEFGGAAAFLAEYSPRRHRGFGVSWLESSSILGFLSASLAVFLLNSALTEEAVTSWGWRIPFLIAGPLAVVGLYIRLKIEDTPNFRALEQAHEVAQAPLREVLRQDWKQLLQMTGVEMLQHVSFYMILVYLLTYQTEEMDLSSASASLSATITSIVAMVCVPLFGVLSDRVGRKPLMMASGLGFVLLSYPAFVLMRGGAFGTVIVVQAGLGILLAIILSTHAVTMAEIFPTRVRQAGLSIGYQVAAAIFAGTVPYLMTYLISATGNPLVPAFYLMLAGAVGFGTTLTLRETAGHPLPQREPVTAVLETSGGPASGPRSG